MKNILIHPFAAVAIALGLPSIALACTAANPELHRDGGQYDEDAAVGAAVTGWKRSSVTLATGCTRGVYSVAATTDIGTASGDQTFVTHSTDGDATGFGVQYRIIGDSTENLTSSGASVSKSIASGTSLTVGIEYRYIRLGTLGVTELSDDPLLSFTINGGSSGTVTAGIDKLFPPPPPPPDPNCSISASNVNMGTLHTAQLPRVGSGGPARRFSWSYSCNSTVSSATLSYSSDTVIDADQGTFGISKGTGNATGVAFALRRGVTSTTEGTPVNFGSSYTGSRSGGTESMLVRYYRTGDMSAGRADGSIKVTVTFN